MKNSIFFTSIILLSMSFSSCKKTDLDQPLAKDIEAVECSSTEINDVDMDVEEFSKRNTNSGISSELFNKIKAYNPNLSSLFLKNGKKTEMLTLPNGDSIHLWKLKQFGELNYRLNLLKVSGCGEQKVEGTQAVFAYLTKGMCNPAFDNIITSDALMKKYRYANKTFTVIYTDNFDNKSAGLAYGTKGGIKIKPYITPSTKYGKRVIAHEVSHHFGVSHGALMKRIEDYFANSTCSNYTTYDLVDLFP